MHGAGHREPHWRYFEGSPWAQTVTPGTSPGSPARRPRAVRPGRQPQRTAPAQAPTISRQANSSTSTLVPTARITARVEALA